MNFWDTIKEFYAGFTLWDFWIIFIVADLSQLFIVSVLVGTVTWWGLGLFFMAIGLWKLHIWSVQLDIKRGAR